MDGFVDALGRAQGPLLTQLDGPFGTDNPVPKPSERVLALSPRKLKGRRIVSFDGADQITRAFDVLRNTCLKDVEPRISDRPIIGVTSPNPKAGVSTTALNLAFALARLRKGKVLLADMAPANESCWHRAGLARKDIDYCLEPKRNVALQVAGLSVHATSLLPVMAGKSGAEAGAALRQWASNIRRELGPVSIVLDLPPLLVDDRATPFVSELDMVVLVMATSKSRIAELEICKSYLHDAAKVQLVLNKARSYDF